MSSDRRNIELKGELVLLQPRLALALGMAVHELITNAVKYGALSVPEGNVEVDWTVAQDAGAEQLVLKWTERHGPPVLPPSRRGFGMTLIERGFPYDVGGEANVEFGPEGVIATLFAPLPTKSRKGPP